MNTSTQRATRKAESKPEDCRVQAARRHDEAVIQAEVRRLARALQPYGVLHRDALEEAADGRHWYERDFDSALGAAVRSGVIERLPAGFYAIPKPSPDPEPLDAAAAS